MPAHSLSKTSLIISDRYRNSYYLKLLREYVTNANMTACFSMITLTPYKVLTCWENPQKN